MIFYSKSTNGFYDDALHADIPADKVEVTPEEHRALFEAQALGKAIRPGGDGRPEAVTPTIPAPSMGQQIAALEASITPRRLREAALGIDGGWFEEIDAKIAGLRAQDGVAS